MTESWLRLDNVTSESFPIEIFGYPEESTTDAEIIYHVVLHSAYQTGTPPLPKQRMRMKIVLADGYVILGEERQSS